MPEIKVNNGILKMQSKDLKDNVLEMVSFKKLKKENIMKNLL